MFPLFKEESRIVPNLNSIWFNRGETPGLDQRNTLDFGVAADTLCSKSLRCEEMVGPVAPEFVGEKFQRMQVRHPIYA